MNFDEVLTPILKKKGIKKDLLIKNLGISRATFFRWTAESIEKRTLEELQKVADVLEIKTTDLLGKEYAINEDEKLNQVMEVLSVYKQLTEVQKEQIQSLKERK